ncbi:MAG: hypothetical protein H0X33_06630 [Taibaiella sp.]|nr:hypothetical protein [Taibaiella sp.]
MENGIKVHTVITADNKTQFIIDKITITTHSFSFTDGKHWIADPATAIAHFTCFGELFNVKNLQGFKTVEDWYTKELLPKFEMLHLLHSSVLF